MSARALGAGIGAGVIACVLALVPAHAAESPVIGSGEQSVVIEPAAAPTSDLVPSILDEVTVIPAPDVIEEGPLVIGPIAAAEAPHSGAGTPARPAPEPALLIDPERLASALVTPCAEEDSADCYWRADLRGNGIGTSFVTVGGHVFPIDQLLEG